MKKILVFALVLALLMMFAGCTGKGKDKSNNGKETSASSASFTESVTDAPSETEATESGASQKQTDPLETSADGSDTTRTGTDTSSSTEQPTEHTETGSSESGTTNAGTDASIGTEPSTEPTETDYSEPGMTEADNSGGLELPIDYFG